MALDAVTIVGLVLGVLGLFGITLMYDITKKVVKVLKSRRILRRRNRERDAEGLPMTSAGTQYDSTVETNSTTDLIRVIGTSHVGIGATCGDVGCTACRMSHRNDCPNTTPSTSSLFVNAYNNGLPTVTTEQHDGLRPSIVRATAVSSYLTSSARNRHRGATTPISLAPIQSSTPAANAPDLRPALPSIPVVTASEPKTGSNSSGTSAAAETSQSGLSNRSDRQTQPARDSRPQQLEDATEDETELAEASTEVQVVTPNKGPITGGEPIVILGVSFPSIRLYVRFGDAFTTADRRNETVLQCILPPASRPGAVPVTLSRVPDRNAPNFGKSFATFRYEDTSIEVLLSLLKLVYEKADGASLENVAALAQQYLQSITSTPFSQGRINTRAAEKHDNALEVEGLEEIAIHFLSNYCRADEWRVTISSRNKHGQTLAHISAMLGYLKLLRYLVIWGIDLNLTDFKGSTALHYAFLCNKAECAIFLIHSGADELILDELGQSAWILNPPLVDEVASRLPSASKIGSSSSMSSRVIDIEYETGQPEAAAALRAKYLLVERWLQQMEAENHATDSLNNGPMPWLRTSPTPLPSNLGYENEPRSAFAHPTQLQEIRPKLGSGLVILTKPPIVHNENSLQEVWATDRDMWNAYTQSDWFKNEEIEPYMPHNGKSILTQWLNEVDEGQGWVCRAPLDIETSWCGEGPFKRLHRAIAHVRRHLPLRPFRCEGRCGREGCMERFDSSEKLHAHQKGPDYRSCALCGELVLRQNMSRHKAEYCTDRTSQTDEET